MEDLRFPDDFVWGVAASSHQIEGATSADGRTPSIWDQFASQPGHIQDGSNGDVACDHYNRYAEDVRLIASLGVRSYRFSIAWSRVLPNGTGAVNAAGLDFYDRLVDALLEAGVSPCATLYHWDLPQVLEEQGGWPTRAVAEAFVRYVDVVTARLGDRVPRWITHNEPWCASMLGYRQGAHAPGRESWPDALAASHHLLLSHGWAVPVIRSNAPQAEVGITLNVGPAEPASPSDADWVAARRFDGELNRWFLDPIFHGAYPQDMVEHHQKVHLDDGMSFVQSDDLEAIGAPIDFLGVNYYCRAVCRSDEISEAENEPRTIHEPNPDDTTDMGWEIHPAGLTDILIRINADYAPTNIYITENGAAFDTPPDDDGRVRDRRRQTYLDAHLRAVLDAIEAGVPVRGYYLWSIFDNFEWGYGYAMRFGIVWVDFDTQERIVKDSGRWYEKVVRNNALTAETAA